MIGNFNILKYNSTIIKYYKKKQYRILPLKMGLVIGLNISVEEKMSNPILGFLVKSTLKNISNLTKPP
jgi:hypothetical protein